MHLIGKTYETNYQGLAGLKLENTTRVNIITGRNNSGKTRLIDSIDGFPMKPTYIDFSHPYNLSLKWTRLSFNTQHDTILNSLRIIEPKLIGVYLDERKPVSYFYQKVEGVEEPIHEAKWGRGFSVLFYLVVTLFTEEKSIILIDDFNPPFHPFILKEVWEVIFSLLKLNDNQLFVATYSKDVVIEAARACMTNKDDQYKKDLVAYCIGKSIVDGRMMSTRYDADRLYELNSLGHSIF